LSRFYSLHYIKDISGENDSQGGLNDGEQRMQDIGLELSLKEQRGEAPLFFFPMAVFV
jgi:hypothetical protein